MAQVLEKRYANNDLFHSKEESNEERISMNAISRTTNIEQKMIKNVIALKISVELDQEVGRGKNKRTIPVSDEITAETIYKLVTTAVKELGLEKRLKECSISRNLKGMIDDCVSWILTSDKSTRKARALKSDLQAGWMKRIVEIALREKSLIAKDESERDGIIAFSNPRVRERMERYMQRRETVSGSAMGGHRSLKSIGMGVEDRKEEDEVLKDIREELKVLTVKLNDINKELIAPSITDPGRIAQLAYEKQATLDRKIALIEKKQSILQTRAQIIQEKQLPMTEALDKVSKDALEAIEKSELRAIEREDQKLLEQEEMEGDEDE